MPWNPKEIRRFIKSFNTGAGTVLVETDAGQGYLKAMGNPGGEHILACEWVGTQLAKWFDLSTFEFSLIAVTEVDEIPLAKGGHAKPGPAFITRLEKGRTWSGTKRDLKRLVNPGDLSRLVVFDTWTRNWDRYFAGGDRPRINRDNVFFSDDAPKRQFRLKAFDHTHCFTWGRDLTGKIATIDTIEDTGLYGLFPEFRAFLEQDEIERALDHLRSLNKSIVEGMVQTIPPQWDVTNSARSALVNLITGRACFLTEKFNLMQAIWPQTELDLESGEEEKS